MKNMIPQILYLALSLAGLLSAAHDHGKLKTGRHKFQTTFVSTIIVFYILYLGGFFDVILNKF